jgi:hypothetical protein
MASTFDSKIEPVHLTEEESTRPQIEVPSSAGPNAGEQIIEDATRFRDGDIVESTSRPLRPLKAT